MVPTKFILGCESSGTSVTCQTHLVNGWTGICDYAAFSEDRQAAQFFNPERFVNGESRLLEYIRGRQKQVVASGGDKYALKIATLGVLEQAHLLHNLSPEISVLLVWRDPEEIVKSARARRMGIKPEYAKAATERVLELNEEYGWPVFRFHQNVTNEELEEAAGEKFPEAVINSDRIGRRWKNAIS